MIVDLGRSQLVSDKLYSRFFFFYCGKSDAVILRWVVTLKTVYSRFCRRFFCNYSSWEKVFVITQFGHYKLVPPGGMEMYFFLHSCLHARSPSSVVFVVCSSAALWSSSLVAFMADGCLTLAQCVLDLKFLINMHGVDKILVTAPPTTTSRVKV